LDIQAILAELRKEQRNLNRAIAALDMLQRRRKKSNKTAHQQADELDPMHLSQKGKKVQPATKRRTRAEIIAFPKRARRESSRIPLTVDSRH
jgi:hypothetical protein